jgi:hypothetical protein
MRPRDRDLAHRLYSELTTFGQNNRALPGIADDAAREVLVEQLLSSVHRVEYARRLGGMTLSPCRMDPNDIRFDPLKAAVLHHRAEQTDDAFWLVFLSVHFGKHHSGGWRYLREVYGRLGDGEVWDWKSVCTDPVGFRAWLQHNQAAIRQAGVPGGFGNHRKYESLDGYSPAGTGTVVASYVEWVTQAANHAGLFEGAIADASGDGQAAFDRLYRDMSQTVRRFGRLARFDYLAMVGKLGLAGIEPGSTYLNGATGPLRGAQMLFGVKRNATTLDAWLAELDQRLQVGMQVLEDALCNWQKSPREFEPFRG